MRFAYAPEAGVACLRIEGETFVHLFKSRRHKQSDSFWFRNLRDDHLYRYGVQSITKNEALLVLEESLLQVVAPKRFVHLGWCVIDPKSIEKALPALNEIGVSKISFVFCAYSQREFRLDMARMERILINSCQQCGRSRLMELEMVASLEEYQERYPHSAVLDFGGSSTELGEIHSLLIGCEGGFSEKERERFVRGQILSLPTPLILRSESAAIAAAVKLLL